jgi:hypothetical protein
VELPSSAARRLRRAAFSSWSFFKASLSAAKPMGAETAINAAKQETKYFLVLGAVLVSDFILIVWGLVVCRSFFSDVSLSKDRKK